MTDQTFREKADSIESMGGMMGRSGDAIEWDRQVRATLLLAEVLRDSLEKIAQTIGSNAEKQAK